MSLFGGTTRVPSGPNKSDIKTTLENVCALLDDPKYNGGLDPSSVVSLIEDIYEYVAGNKNKRLRLPAPANDPDDRYRIMWAEGAKVKSRPSSVSSKGSVDRHTSNKLSSIYSSRNSTETKPIDRAMSVTSSSKYTSRYIGIIDEEPISLQQPPLPPRSNRRDSITGSNTMRVNGATVRPSNSLEAILSGNHQQGTPPHPLFNEQDDEPTTNFSAARRNRSKRNQSGQVAFADDQ